MVFTFINEKGENLAFFSYHLLSMIIVSLLHQDKVTFLELIPFQALLCMFSPLRSAPFLCSFASRSTVEAFHSFPSASTHTCLLLHVSAVFPSYRCTSLWAEFVCAYACVCLCSMSISHLIMAVCFYIPLPH